MFNLIIREKKRLILIPLMIILFSIPSFAQELKGSVYDEHHNPIPGTQIYIPAISRGTVTDASGYFILDNLPDGVYTITFSYVGFKKEVRQIDTKKLNGPLTITLKASTLELPDVTVTGTPQPTDVLSSSQSVAVVDQRQFERESGATAMAALKNVSGVTLLSTGAGIAKPVIHGLSSQRVVVVVDGVRQEAQNWGDEHGPQVDPFQVKKMEVVKGPSSVLYGSGALGGVVNVITPSLPGSDGHASVLSGRVSLGAYSNNKQGAGALELKGSDGSIGYRAQFSHLQSGNISTPNGELFNSGVRKSNGDVMLGTTQHWGTVSLDYSHLYQRLEIHENPVENPGATGYQPLQNDMFHLKANIPTSFLRYEINAGYQHNDRQEFESKVATTPGLHLVLNTGTFDVKAHHAPIGPVYGTFGVSSMIQSNRTLAVDKLIPGYNQQDYAAFVYEQAKFGVVNLSAGGRFDTRNLDVLKTTELGVPAVNKKYNAFSGSFGAVYHILPDFSVTANIGNAWRAPTVFELFVNGVHEGTLRYEVGDSNLKPEKATNIESSLKYVSSSFVGEITLYNNHISRYIFGNPTNQIDPASGFRKYDITQANARIRGIDAQLQIEITNWLAFDGSYSMLRGKNLELNSYLPFMPADHSRVGFHLTESQLGKLHQPYFSIHTSIYAKQNRVAENEPVTKGYVVVDASLGSDVHVGNTPLQVDLSVDNLFNKAYTDHLSRYREYALNPGRNVVLKVQVPFRLVK